MAKSGAQAQAEKPEAQKGSATKMPIFLTKFDGSGSDNTDEFRRTLIGHIELQGIAAGFYKALLKGELSCTAQCLVDHEPRKNDPEAFKAALELHGPGNFRRALELGKAPKRSADEVSPSELMEFAKASPLLGWAAHARTAAQSSVAAHLLQSFWLLSELWACAAELSKPVFLNTTFCE